MLGHTHVLIAGATWAAVWWRPLAAGDLTLTAPLLALSADLTASISSLAAVGLGALLPDLDHPGALLARWKPAGRGGPFGIKRLFMPLLIPSLAVRETLGHRGALHSVAAGTAICALVESAFGAGGAPGAGLTLGWGYAAHLLADLLTRRGVPLLWPLTRHRIALPGAITVKTGSFGEALYLTAFSALSALHAAGALPTQPSP